ncbi:hypothetical protein LOC71_08260 [Rhodopirellula sp. JC740]|uniref:Uncharacterized protein n=1 Tax=Rhodopirellula halodulae TaxID=2894198 RepID=A0ABS8NFD8_9BACT|nr:hypothetical protein [Rhodopirellula sp. JC740]MCC9642265.1 hypothetical protein [Rhodopirellula sp. JC740]
MGWMIGVGLLLIALASLSAISALISAVRFVARNDQTPLIAYTLPAIAAIVGSLCFLIVRFARMPPFLYDDIGVAGLGFLLLAVAVGLYPHRTASHDPDGGSPSRAPEPGLRPVSKWLTLHSRPGDGQRYADD